MQVLRLMGRWFVVIACVINLAHVASLLVSRENRGSRAVFHPKRFSSSTFPRLGQAVAAMESHQVDSFVEPPPIQLSATERTRTITHICSGGTLSTISTADGAEGFPFGSYVDYILDERGWPVLLLSDLSLHAQNIARNPAVSLFVQLPVPQASSSSAALSRVSILGKVSRVPVDQVSALKLAFSIIHPYAEQIAETDRFHLATIQPTKIFFSGGVQQTWVNVTAYEAAQPDVLAQDVPHVLARVNIDKQTEILLVCKHLLKLDNVEVARIQAIDRLGVDIRVKIDDATEEYRIGFRHQVNSAEDAKSELTKLFQEVWEREQGFYFSDSLPPFSKYTQDILR